MRTLMVVLSAALGLCACATDESVIREARANCQTVGITEKDPQFAVCMQALSRQHLEDRIHETYQRANSSLVTDAERRTPHVDAY
jgi:hypothetical protein